MRFLSEAAERSLLKRVKVAHQKLVKNLSGSDLADISYVLGTLSSIDPRSQHDLPTIYVARAMIKAGQAHVDRDAADAASERLVDAAKAVRDRMLVKARSAIREANAILRRLKLTKKRDIIKARKAAQIYVKNVIEKAVGEASREWRVAVGVLVHEAMEEGKASSIVKSYGDESLVWKKVAPDCCRFCRLLYTRDGVVPRLFSIGELVDNGSNIGRRAGRPVLKGENATEWRAVLGVVHPNCLLPGTRVGARVEGAVVSRYEGPAVEIETQRGLRLRVTANHPVMTSQGVVAAGLLREGMYVVSNPDKIWESPTGVREIDDQQAPPFVEDVARALREISPRFSTTPSVDDLHGDACYVRGDVDVVLPDRFLTTHLQAASLKEIDQIALPLALTQQVFHARASGGEFSIEGNCRAAHGSPSFAALAFHARTIATHLSPLQRLRFGLPSQGNVSFLEPRTESASSDPHIVGNLLQRLSGYITLDEIVEVRDFSFSGHVYDLQSSTGWIVAEGIVVSNCRCTLQVLPPKHGFDKSGHLVKLMKKAIVLESVGG